LHEREALGGGGAGRRVEALDLSGGRRYSVTTSVTGGFSIPVPPGKYRLEVELREGERVLLEALRRVAP